MASGSFKWQNLVLPVSLSRKFGGRIHVGYDKTNGYDFFYRQNVIKPALVGISRPMDLRRSGIELAQHHRPSTFMPVEVKIERNADGSVIVWCSDHDPMLRMNGMHGVCLYPGKSYLELKVRLYNRKQSRYRLFFGGLIPQLEFTKNISRSSPEMCTL